MTAKDYKICPGMYHAYISRPKRQNPNVMSNDRRIITDDEILGLIDWFLDRMTMEGEHGVKFDSYEREGYEIILKYRKKD